MENMKYIAETKKDINDTVRDLETSIKANGFGILHTYNLKEILKSKGIDLPQECRIFEICNPVQASEALAEDMNVNMALPCRLSIWQDKDGHVKIGMISPKAILESLSGSPALKDIAIDVEEKMKAMIWAAK